MWQTNNSGYSSIDLGLSIENLSKILKCAGNDDTITLQAEEEPSTIRFTFEGQSSLILYRKWKIFWVQS